MIDSRVLEYVGVGDGRSLPSAMHGSYPLIYISDWSNVLCAECARQIAEDDPYETVSDVGVNWEDGHLRCDKCSERIPSAYGDDDDDS